MTNEPPSNNSRDQFTFIASDSANVTQFGVVHDVNVYNVSDATDPTKKYRIARNYLNGNMPRQAAHLISEAVMEGLGSTESAYFWALAVLSGRSLDHLDEPEFAQLSAAFTEASRHPYDEWRTALDVVANLIQCLTEQEREGELDSAQFDEVLASYDQLPLGRKDEIRRHLEMILTGGMQDKLAAVDAAEVARQRMSGDRARRAWKFFEPEPTPPKPFEGSGSAMPPLSGIAQLVAGVVLSACAVSLSLAAMWRAGGSVTIMAIALGGAGALLILRFGTEQLRLTSGRRRGERRLHPMPKAGLPVRTGDRDLSGRRKAQKEFVDAVGIWVDAFYEESLIRRGKEKHPDVDDLDGAKAVLKDDLVRRYIYDHPLPAVQSIAWLIGWHVHRTVDAWESGRLYEFRQQLATPARTVLALVAGVTTGAVGYIFGLMHLLASGIPTAVPAVALSGLGIYLTWKGGAAACRHRFEYNAEQADGHQRSVDELAAYTEWANLLVDRPTDAEMASWLDYDKAHIKALAMKDYRLANRDILAHLVLTERAPLCRRARVLYGPPRYSNYEVKVFLLTSNGVRQVTVILNFRTGDTSNEQHRAFRYHVISSAEVAEVGVRIDGKRRQIVESDNGDSKSNDGSQKLMLAQALRLTLNSTQSIHVIVENFDEGLIDRMREDARYLSELACDTSGVTSALRILEAVAAEGDEWVRQERARRNRRLTIYQQREQQRRTELNSSLAALPGADIERDLWLNAAEAAQGTVKEVPFPSPKRPTKVRIPAGVVEGQRLRVSGLGEPAPVRGLPGDLYMTIRISGPATQ